MHATMARLRVSASSVALCLLFSLMAVAHCVPLEEAGDLASDASAAAVAAVPDESEEILRFGVAVEGEAPMEEEKEKEEVVVNPVAEPDPDREEELTSLKPSSEIEQSNDEGEEKMLRKIHRHHRVEKEQEKKPRWWRKAIISRRSRFGHGRRSQREESQTEEVKN